MANLKTCLLMKFGIKSELLSKCLKSTTTEKGDVSELTVLVINGAAIVNILQQSTSRTFDYNIYYADLVFCP